MKIQLLGTSAAPTWPNLFSDTEQSRKIRTLGGKNIRSRHQSIIDDTHVIDLGLDTFYHSVKYDVDFSQIMDIFVTHSHEDHFTPDQLEYASQGCYAYSSKYSPIDLYGNETVINLAKPYLKGGVNLHTLDYYDSVTTRDGYIWTALPAAHKKDEKALNYIIRHDGKTVLYKVDSGPYTDEKLWDFLSSFRFDCIITECTFTFETETYEDHEKYSTVLSLKDRLMKMNCISDKTPFWLTHIHYITGGLSHDEMQKICDRDNISVGYDGAIINI